jgi:hypothetical protein
MTSQQVRRLSLRALVAHHEAGHALVAWALPHGSASRVVIHPDPVKPIWHGLTQPCVSPADVEGLPQRRILQHIEAIALGGWIAEGVLLRCLGVREWRQFEEECASDAAKVHEARRLLGLLDDFNTERGLSHARRLVKTHWSAVVALAAHLLEHEKASTDTTDRIFQAHVLQTEAT